jgi:hypothetical protein
MTKKSVLATVMFHADEPYRIVLYQDGTFVGERRGVDARGAVRWTDWSPASDPMFLVLTIAHLIKKGDIKPIPPLAEELEIDLGSLPRSITTRSMLNTARYGDDS